MQALINNIHKLIFLFECMSKPSKFIVFIFILSLIGSVLEIWGEEVEISKDITTHLLGAPETFFSPPHTVLYSGVGIGVIAAVLASVTLFKNRELRNSTLSLGMKLIIIGSIIQIFAGPSDYT